MSTGFHRHAAERAMYLKAAAGVLMALCASLAIGADNDSAVARLLVQKQCNACHDKSNVSIGPPYLAIASRRSAEQEQAVEVLARKIVLGGGGAWGAVPMVPNEHVTLDEARTIAQWILALKPAA